MYVMRGLSCIALSNLIHVWTSRFRLSLAEANLSMKKCVESILDLETMLLEYIVLVLEKLKGWQKSKGWRSIFIHGFIEHDEIEFELLERSTHERYWSAKRRQCSLFTNWFVRVISYLLCVLAFLHQGRKWPTCFDTTSRYWQRCHWKSKWFYGSIK